MVFASDWTKYLTHDPLRRMRYASAKHIFSQHNIAGESVYNCYMWTNTVVV